MLTNILQKNNLKLISLNIGGNQLGDRNFSEICVGISKNYYLLKLFAHDNDLAKISSTIIGTILRYDKKLIVIDLSKNNFNDETIVFLLKGLISNSSLESLYLNENNLTNNCLRTFETTLSINTSLKELFLEKNKFTPKACDMISEFLNKNKYLEYLSLVGNKLRNDNIDLILDKQKKIGAKVITKTDFYQTKLSYKEKINFYEYIY
jgi:Ran GTPase-activating protein (RanGAP) involved in mRNA processing and transport